MSEIKHTPWRAEETRVYFANGSGGFDLRNCPDPEEKARLCAAAPELLAALIRARVYVGMVTEFDKDDPIFSAIDAIDAAISKATGAAA